MQIWVWPITVFTFAVAAMLIFLKPLTRFVDRTRKISKTGIETVAVGQNIAKSDVNPASAVDEFARRFDNEFLLKCEDSIRVSLIPLAGAEASKKESALIRMIAGLSIIIQFENTYRVIFGSQLRALTVANTTPGGVQIEVFESIYYQAAATYKEWYANASFEQWHAYMTNQSLIVISDKVSITVEGKEFLKYLVQKGYSIQKPG